VVTKPQILAGGFCEPDISVRNGPYRARRHFLPIVTPSILLSEHNFWTGQPSRWKAASTF
jgi:hypothetical protein